MTAAAAEGALQRSAGASAGETDELAQRKPGLTESIFISAVMLILFGAFWPPDEYFHAGPVITPDTNIYNFSVNALIALFLGLMALVHGRRFFAAQLRNPLLWSLPALALASAAWSSDPLVVVKRAGSFTVTTAFAIYVYHRYDTKRLIGLLTRVHFLLALMNLAVIAIAPGLALSPHGETGSFRGVETGKNELGEVAGLGIITAAYAFPAGTNIRLLPVAVLIGDFALLYLSRSVSALFALTIAVALMTLGWLMQTRNTVLNLIGAAATLTGGMLAAVVYAHKADLLAAVNKRADLTGRTELWDAVIAAIKKHPLLGYGFGNFWQAGNQAAVEIWALLPWHPPNAHNGWLEVALQLGYVGVAVVALVFVVATWRFLRLILSGNGAGVVYFGAVVATALVRSGAESALLRQDHFPWAMLVFAYAHLAHEAARHSSPAGKADDQKMPAPNGSGDFTASPSPGAVRAHAPRRAFSQRMRRSERPDDEG